MNLVLALLDTSAAIADSVVAARARELTIDWARFKYFGPIVEAASLEEVLARASALGRRYCVVQVHGHVIAERWRAEQGEPADPLVRLERWLAGRELLAAGSARADGRLDRRCLAVDLARWQAAGRPELACMGEGIEPLPASFLDSCLHLAPELPAAAGALARWLGPRIADFDPALDGAFEPAARRFLSEVRRLITGLPNGIFVWNLEPYDDIESPPAGFRRPLAAVYGVAAGFKTNRLLETHGFDERTHVVFFDYSAPGLEFRRRLLERWNGRDYPVYLRRLFAEGTTKEAFYCLWQDTTPRTVDWQVMEERWRRELEAWGGARAFADHWRRYRRLEHRFVHCDLHRRREPLLRELERTSGDGKRGEAAIWWSNAFFTVVSNWLSGPAERRRIYEDFLDELAARAPRLLLYGASSDNIAVNGVRAAEYRDWLAREGGDELEPGVLQRCAILF